MTLQELFEAANAANSELVEKTASIIKELEQHDVSFTQDVYADFNKIASVTEEKLASVAGDAAKAGIGSGLKAMGLALGGAAAVALGGAMATDLFDAAKRGLTKADNFKRIMAANPDLKRTGDTQRLKATFDSLHRFAPEFTSDPLMGGAILKNLMESLPGSEPRAIGELIRYRKELIDARNSQFRVQGKADVLLNAYKTGKRGEKGEE